MSPQQPWSYPGFLREEEQGWDELEHLVGSLTPDQIQRPGFLPGWSVKDFLAHIAGWLSEAGHVLIQVQSGTYTESDRDGVRDVDARNAAFVEANREQPLEFVRREARATRHRLLRLLHGMAEIPPAAQAAVRAEGPEHYAQHLPRLREWVAELRSGSPPVTGS